MNKIEARYKEVEAELEELKRDLEDVESQLDNFDVSEHFSEEDYEDMLNDEGVQICGYRYLAGLAFRKVDYTRFREDYNNYLDSLDPEEFSEYLDLLGDKAYLEEDIAELEAELDDLDEEYEVE